MKQHSWYSAFRSMHSRCVNPLHHAFNSYGGRGITVDPRWNDFWTFVADIERECGSKPTPQHTLDRIDNDGNYEPGNVRWATKKDQSRNTRKFSTNTSGYIGVWYRSDRRSWVAQIYVDDNRIILGHFKSAEEAARAYDRAARKYHGTSAKQNFT